MYVGVHKATGTSSWGSSEHPVMLDVGTGVIVSEFMVGEVSKLIELELVRLIHLVGVMHVHDILFEHIEALVLLV